MLNYLWDPMLNDATLRAVEAFLRPTPIGEFMRTSRWAWPICESLHFTGMTVLVGVVAFSICAPWLRAGGADSRAPSPDPARRRGFVVTALTGFCSSLDSRPYCHLAFLVEGRVLPHRRSQRLVFYTATFKRLLELAPSGGPPLAARNRWRRVTVRLDRRHGRRLAADVFQAVGVRIVILARGLGPVGICHSPSRRSTKWAGRIRWERLHHGESPWTH